MDQFTLTESFIKVTICQLLISHFAHQKFKQKLDSLLQNYFESYLNVQRKSRCISVLSVSYRSRECNADYKRGAAFKLSQVHVCCYCSVTMYVHQTETLNLLLPFLIWKTALNSLWNACTGASMSNVYNTRIQQTWNTLSAFCADVWIHPRKASRWCLLPFIINSSIHFKNLLNRTFLPE